MKKKFANYLLALFLVVGIISCDNPMGPGKSDPIPESGVKNELQESGKTEMSQEESIEFVEDLIDSGLVFGVDFEVKNTNGKTTVTLTEVGKDKLDKQNKVESGNVSGKTQTVDLSSASFVNQIGYGEEYSSASFDLPLLDEDLKLGDVLKVTLKASVSKSLSNLSVGIYYNSKNGRVYLDKDSFKNIEKTITKDEPISVDLEFKNNKLDISKKEVLYVEVRTTDIQKKEVVFIENDAPSSSRHYKVESGDSGVRLELFKLPGESRKANSGSSIHFFQNNTEIPLGIALSNKQEENELYDFPFVEKDVPVYVSYFANYEYDNGNVYSTNEIVKIIPHSSKRISDYVDMDLYNQLEAKVKFDDSKKEFTLGFNTEGITNGMFTSNCEQVNFSCQLCAGALDWSNTAWIGGNNGNVENENLIADASNDAIPFIWFNEDERIPQILNYNKTYWASFVLSIKVGNHTYDLPTVFSELYTFTGSETLPEIKEVTTGENLVFEVVNNSSKDVDLTAELLKNGNFVFAKSKSKELKVGESCKFNFSFDDLVSFYKTPSEYTNSNGFIRLKISSGDLVVNSGEMNLFKNQTHKIDIEDSKDVFNHITLLSSYYISPKNKLVPVTSDDFDYTYELKNDSSFDVIVRNYVRAWDDGEFLAIADEYILKSGDTCKFNYKWSDLQAAYEEGIGLGCQYQAVNDYRTMWGWETHPGWKPEKRSLVITDADWGYFFVNDVIDTDVE